MKYAAYAVTAFVMLAQLPMLYIFIKRLKDNASLRSDKNHYVIWSSSGTILLSIIVCFLFALILLLLNLFSTAPIVANAICLPFCLILTVLCCLSARYKVIVVYDQITFTPYIGKKKSCTFSDISQIKHKVLIGRGAPNNYYILKDKNGKRLFSLDGNLKGSRLFLDKVNALNIPIEQ